MLLFFNARRNTVVLTREFRFPTFVNGNADGMKVEACAGLLDGDDPETCICREAAEETGFHIRNPRKVFEAYMSLGSDGFSRRAAADHRECNTRQKDHHAVTTCGFGGPKAFGLDQVSKYGACITIWPCNSYRTL